MITAAQYHWSAKYREDMDQMRCDNPACTSCSDVLHLHSSCPHGDRHLDIGCHHPSHELVLACSACERVLWSWHLAQHGRHHHDKGETELCTWGWEDWDKLAEGHEYTRFRMCHPESTEVIYVKARGEIQSLCALGCNSRERLRHAIRSRASEVVQ
jgi:hypothetical protein